MGLVISHLKTMMEMKTNNNMINNIPMEQPIPTEFTSMAFPLIMV